MSVLFAFYIITFIGLLLSQSVFCVKSRERLLDELSIPDTEFQALYDLYNSTNGESWLWRPNTTEHGARWNFTSPNNNPCEDQWQGINCTTLDASGYRHIHSIELSQYGMHGRLPSSLSQLANLSVLFLPSNALTGPVPPSLGELSRLRVLDLSINAFSGVIPASLGSLGNLDGLYLYSNALSHTLPASIGNLTLLTDLYVEHNLLTGTIPETVQYMTNLVNLDLYNNSFVGTLPHALSYLTQLTFLGLDTNYFSGPIPPYIEQYTLLLDLDLNNNLFTGTLPPALSRMPSLQFLRIHTNYFTSTIPPELVQLTQLQYLELNENMLTGTIPHTLSQLPQLSLVMLQSNQLGGTLDNIFDPATQTSLANIQLNNNQLTGTLPDSLFMLKSLNTLVLVSNCLHGTLPTTMCSRKDSNLYSLVLDGLSSASSCQHKLLYGLSEAYIIRNAVHGSIPLCVFSLPNLTTLHLSGNSLTGSLPQNLDVNPGLIDLILSHNLLTGVIPDVIQVRKWYNLDLSFNRIGGTLRTNFATVYPNISSLEYARLYESMLGNETAPSLALLNNRLSGHIPATILTMQDVSVLGNNVFECELDNTGLPVKDPNRYNYQCASTEFEIPFYSWLGLCVLVVLIVVILLCMRRTFERYIPIEQYTHNIVRWLEYSKQGADGRPILTEFYALLNMLCYLTAGITLFTVVVLLPVYGTLSAYYAAITHKYAWLVSAAFLTGDVPFGLEFVLWIGMLCIVLATFATLITHTRLNELKRQLRTGEVTIRPSSTDLSTALNEAEAIAANTRSATYTTLSTRSKNILIYTCYILLNLIVVVGANVVYVYVAIYEDSNYLIFAQIMLSIFKIAWNNVMRERSLQRIAQLVISREGYVFVEKDFASLQIFVSLVNNIAIPCFVVASISPRCFYNVFVAAPAVSAHFTYQSCNVDPLTGYCVLSAAHRTTSYNPPYTYNYQCSSSLITYYAPAFASMCIISTFVLPTLHVMALFFYKHARNGGIWQYLLRPLVPTIMLPLPPPVDKSIDNDGSKNTGSTINNNTTTNTSTTAVATTYFPANPIFCALITDLGVLLTYGVMFPPLAVALAVTVIVSALFAKVKVGRFITNAIAQHTYQADQYIEVVVNDCEGVGSAPVLRKAMWMLITGSCWFYTLFMFDTLGDTVGLRRAYWVLIVMPLMPLVLYAAYTVYTRCTPPPQLPASPAARPTSMLGAPSLYSNSIIGSSFGKNSIGNSVSGGIGSSIGSMRSSVGGSGKGRSGERDKVQATTFNVMGQQHL